MPDGVVDFVCACVVEVFAFEPDLRAAEVGGEAFGVVNGAGAADIVF